MTTSKEVFRQVLLSRPITPYVKWMQHADGYKEDVFWIDNKLAKIGKKVKDEDGVIWTIKDVYNAKEFEDIEQQRATWKRFAEVLDGH